MGNLRAIDYQERSQRDVSPLDLGLIEQPTRPRSSYTVGIRKAALDEANSGTLREAADLTLAAVTESGYARGILADLTHGLWGLPKTFIGDPEMIAALDDTPARVGEWRTLFPQPEAIRLMTWGITLGVAPGQMRRKYGARPGDAYPVSPDEAKDWRATKAANPYQSRPVGANDTRTLRTWSPKWLRNQWWDDTWWLMTADGEIRISPLDDTPDMPEPGTVANITPRKHGDPNEWLLYTPYGPTKPWEWGAWKSLSLAFVLSRDAIFDAARHSEVLGPVRVGKVPQGTTERQRRKYLDNIKSMQRMGILVLPPGLEYSVLESSGRIADLYFKIIEWGERDLAMMTGALTTPTGSAGFSKGDVQERFTRSILSAFGDSLSTCLHGGGVVPWARENYGRADAPRAEWNTEAPEDQKTRAETLKIAGEALDALADGLDRHGFAIADQSVVAYMQGLGFEVVKQPVKTLLPKIDVTPTAREFAYTLDEVRASDGYNAIGDDRGSLTIAEAEQLAKKKAADAPAPGVNGPAGGGDDGAPVDVAPLEGEAPPTDDSAQTLAAKMSEHGVGRCEHGSNNRCHRCGIERVRDFVPAGRGKPVRWVVAWRPIFAARTEVPS